MLAQELVAGRPDDATQDKGHNDGVVELARDRDEVGHQIDWVARYAAVTASSAFRDRGTCGSATKR
jgi:hypothetical protein